MIRLECDYGEGAHPAILEKLLATNMEQTPGYGCDAYCAEAARLIRQACVAPEADVHFIVGGTLANLLAITAALRQWQGVLCADSGHISTHETGAIEAAGHKVLQLPGIEGKISADQVREACRAWREDASYEHIVEPGMVYISSPTEFGTMYSLQDLEEISAACRENGLFLYVDGARMAYGLTARGNALKLSDYARLCDMFTIGGTKCGALFGEALVICNPDLKRGFRPIMKQRGAMLGKGRLLGLQFLVMFENNLYFQLGQRAIDLSDRLRAVFAECGYPMLVNSPTNQIFPILPDAAVAILQQNFAFYVWQRVDSGHSAVRFCVSWATPEANVDALIAAVRALPK